MALTDALFAGTSGLKGLGHGMSVIGDNVTNLNTTAFKGARISFSDVMAQSINTASGSGQLGRGSTVQALYPIFGQGSFESTANPTDLAIAGNGFFIVRSPGSTGNILYTRDGQFTVDKNGYLVNPAGFRVQGWRIDENTGDITGAITDIKIEKSSPPQATSHIDLITNLDAREELESAIINLGGDIQGENIIKLTDVVTLQYDSNTSTSPELFNDTTGSNPLTFTFIDDNFEKKTIYIRKISISSYSVDSNNNLIDYKWSIEWSLDGSNWNTAYSASNTDNITINTSTLPVIIDLSNVEKQYNSGTDSHYARNYINSFEITGTRVQKTRLNLRDINGKDKKIEIGLLYNASTQTWSYQVKDINSGTILVAENGTTSTNTKLTLNNGEKFTISWNNVGHISTREDYLSINAPTGLVELEVPSLPSAILKTWNRFDFEVKDNNGNTHYLEAWLKLTDKGWNYVIVEVANQNSHNNNIEPLQLTSDGNAIQNVNVPNGTILAMGINYNLPGGTEQKSTSFYLANSTQEVHLDWSNLDDNTANKDIYLFGSVVKSNATGTNLSLNLLDSSDNKHHLDIQMRYNDSSGSWQAYLDSNTGWINMDTSGTGIKFYIHYDTSSSNFTITNTYSSGDYTVYIKKDGTIIDGRLYTGLQAVDNNAKVYLSDRDIYATETLNTLLEAWDARNETPLASTEYTYRTTLTIYDALGTPHEVTVFFDRTTQDNVYEFLVTVNPQEDQRDFLKDLENPLEELNRAVFEGTGIPPTPQYFYNEDTHTHVFRSSANTWLQQKRGGLMYGRIKFDRQGNLEKFLETYRLDPNTGKPVQLFKEDGSLVEAPEDGFSVIGANGYPLLVADFLGLNLDDPNTYENNKNDIQTMEMNLGYYYKDGRWHQESVRTTQYATSNSTIFYDQNGFGPGYLETVSVDTDGVITGHYSNGRVIPLWMVALANFNAPEGLQKVGGNLFRETTESGPPITGKPRTNGLGSIAPNSLEQSNVDLGEQFVKMIIFQRGFQADARIITVTDTMLDELINLKR